MAYEGGGVLLWDYATDSRPLTRFRLVSAGFRIDVAAHIMQILEGIIGVCEETVPQPCIPQVRLRVRPGTTP
jgi:hypothetical protein